MDVDARRASELRALSGSRSAARLRLRRLDALAWLVLVLAVLLSVWFGYVSWLQARRTAEAQFMARSEAVSAAMLNRVAAYEDIVRAAAGMLEANPQLDQAGFNAYVGKLQLARRHPGVQTLGFARRVPGSELPRYLLAQRVRHGPDFDVHPRVNGNEHFIVDLLYPDIPAMRHLLGTDVSAEPARRAALAAAHNSGELAAARRVTFGNPARGPTFSGFLLYAPVYVQETRRTPAADASPGPGKRSLQGYTSAGFGWDRMIQEAIASVTPSSWICNWNHRIRPPASFTNGVRRAMATARTEAHSITSARCSSLAARKLSISSAPRGVAFPPLPPSLSWRPAALHWD